MITETDARQIPTIDRDGGRMPVLGLGTWEITGAACRKAVITALAMGYRHVDTARMYENEKEVGVGIRESGVPRADLFLTTKLKMGNVTPARARQSCEQSLALLDTPYIDLLLIHWPEEGMDIPGILGVMADLKQEGLIRHLGVSNFTVPLMRKAVEATGEPVFCNQIEYNPYTDPGPVLPYCRQLDVAIVAYSPLGRGRVPKDSLLADIGLKYGKSPSQVTLRWLLSQDGVAAIPKGSSEKHLRDNLAVFDFDVDPEDLRLIGGLAENL